MSPVSGCDCLLAVVSYNSVALSGLGFLAVCGILLDVTRSAGSRWWLLVDSIMISPRWGFILG